MKAVILGARGFDLLEENLAETFHYMGHEAAVVDVYQDLPVFSRLGKRTLHTLMRANYGFSVRLWKSAARDVVEHNPDLVIVTDREVVPEAIVHLKQQLRDIPIVHLNPDHAGNLGRQYILMSPYDALVTKEPFLADSIKRLYGAKAFYLPESFNPRVHVKPVSPKATVEADMNVDLIVIASLNPYRVRFLESLLKCLPSHLRISIYGSSKPMPWVGGRLRQFHGNRYLVGAEKARAFYGAKIALNTMHPAEFHGVNCRFFEALGSGAFLLTEDRPVIVDLAVPDEEVVTFRDVQEAASKIQYYLDHDSERLAIAEAGYRRALRDHTYEKRIEAMLAMLDGGAKAAT
ncbi:MAG: glycosyltransferase [Deltaproteobacteria bacterium]|nr:glycosyltransferase [Deltaproteobacteria bacterium]